MEGTNTSYDRNKGATKLYGIWNILNHVQKVPILEKEQNKFTSQKKALREIKRELNSNDAKIIMDGEFAKNLTEAKKAVNRSIGMLDIAIGHLEECRRCLKDEIADNLFRETVFGTNPLLKKLMRVNPMRRKSQWPPPGYGFRR